MTRKVRVHALERIPVTRIVATPDALDDLKLPGHRVLRTAPDEVLILPPVPDVQTRDRYALIAHDSGFAGVWLEPAFALAFLEGAAEWPLPEVRPAYAQGAVAGVAAKVCFEADRVLILIPAPLMHDFSEALAAFRGPQP